MYRQEVKRKLKSISRKLRIRFMRYFALVRHSIYKVVVLWSVLLMYMPAKATHNRAGEIIYTHISGYTFKVCIITYTKASSAQADRDSLIISWGDGGSDTLARSVKDTIGPDIQHNVYCGIHTFTGPGCYLISMQDPNRISDIVNIAGGNGSVTVPFALVDTLCIKDPAFFGYINSPRLLNPPVDMACAGQLFIHDPGAYDPDGDSLSFSIIPPVSAPGKNVPGYVDPSTIRPGPNNKFSIDVRTGIITWNAPQAIGIYNIAILIRAYRKINGKYYQVASIERDMQIIVNACDNRPPVIVALQDTCVIAGDTINRLVKATDPDSGQHVTLTASGGPFIAGPPDVAHFTSVSYVDSAIGHFIWHTNCIHIEPQPYSVTFKAQDDFHLENGTKLPLSDLKAWRIKVVAPPPQKLAAIAAGNDITLTWQSPYKCEGSPHFIGFSVWRREGCAPFSPDVCHPENLRSLGFILLDSGLTVYTYSDNTPQQGKSYQYVVQANFGRLASSTALGSLYYNTSSSIASTTVCIQLKKDVPIITNVSVDSTNHAKGKIYIAWSKPRIPDYDTLRFPSPYRYDIYRGIAGGTNTLIHSYNEPYFKAANDTIYEDTALNTVGNQYQYFIKFLSNNKDSVSTKVATSVYLNTNVASHTIQLIWNASIPWQIDSSVIFRKGPGQTKFDSLTTVKVQKYTDTNLENDSTYCYYIKTMGGYSATGLKSPLINLSQRICTVPIDTTGPCPPVLTVQNSCSNNLIPFLENLLTWQNVNHVCATQDGVKYLVYFRRTLTGPFSLLTTINNVNDTLYTHLRDSSITGCYAVRGIDSVGNLGKLSNIVCVDNCPTYILPNAFTPDNDGHNDYYHPRRPIQFIDHINMNIYNRWGEQVFTTNDIEIHWDGKDIYTGKMLPDGVYYYTCDVYSTTLKGVQKYETLKGYIHIIKN